MGNPVRGGNWKWAVALAAIAVAVVGIAVMSGLMAPSTPSGGIGCLFYSTDSTPSGYMVYATISNNFSYPVNMEKVYFDGAEQAYSADFPAGISGIWSMEAGGQPTRVLNPGKVGVVYVRATAADPGSNHTVKVATNASSFEFVVAAKRSSLTLINNSFHQAPGYEYLEVDIGNAGTAPGYVVELLMDGEAYQYTTISGPPKIKSSWSILVEGHQTPVIGVGQQGVVYVDTSDICHSCTHAVKVSCSDGSYIEFSFRPW